MNLLSKRRFASLGLGIMLAGMALRLAACSAVDPNPPNPHLNPDLLLVIEMPDASSDATEEAP
jgi:hypothetical protein